MNKCKYIKEGRWTHHWKVSSVNIFINALLDCSSSINTYCLTKEIALHLLCGNLLLNMLRDENRIALHF